MTKKIIKNELDEYGFSDSGDLDMPDFDFNMEPPKDDRKASTKIASAFLGGAKDNIVNPATVRRLVKTAMPRGYGEAFDLADQTSGTIKNLYNTAAQEIKPAIKDLKRVTSKILPSVEGVLPKKMTERIKSWTTDKSSSGGAMSEDEQREAALTMQMGEIFKFQAEEGVKRNAEVDAGNRIKDSIENARHKDTFGQMNAMRISLQQLANYQTKIESNFQRKSLELQFRHYFVAQDAFKEQMRMNAVLQTGIAEIVKNTGLPEFAKLKQSERFQEIMRNKFINGTADTIFNKRRAIVGNVGKRLASNFKDKFSSMASDFSMGLGAVDSVMEMQEMQKQFAEMGMGPAQSGTEMAAGLGGGMFADSMMTRAGKAVGKLTGKNNAIRKTGNNLSNYSRNTASHLNDFANTDKWDDVPLIGWLMRMGKAAVKDELRVDTGLQVDNAKTMGNPDIFNRQSNKTLNEIIPGYLARIHREIVVGNTGDTSTSLLEYDFKSNKFVDRKALVKSVRDTVISKYDKESTTDQINKLVDKLDTGDTKFTPDQRKELGNLLFKRSQDTRTTGAKALTNEETYSGVSADSSALYMARSKKYFGDDSDNAKDLEFTSAVGDIGDSVQNKMEIIQTLVNTGKLDILEELGFITPGSTNVNMEKLNAYLFDTSPAAAEVSKELKAEAKTSNPSTRYKSKRRQKVTKRTATVTQATFSSPVDSDYYEQAASSGISDSEPIISAIKENSAKSASELINTTLLRIEAKLHEGISGLEPGTASGAWYDKSIKESLKDAKNKGVAVGKSVFGFVNRSFIKAKDLVTSGLKTGKEFAIKAFNWGKDKLAEFNDVYIDGEMEPRLLAWKLKAGHYYDEATDTVIRSYKDIKGKVVEKAPNGVVTEVVSGLQATTAYIKTISGKKLISSLGSVVDKIKAAGNKVREKLPEFYKAVYDVALKAYGMLSYPQDLYIKGRDTPVILAATMRAGGYFSAIDKSKITNTSEITGAVLDHNGDYVLTAEQFAEGLFCKDGTPLITGHRKILDLAKKGYEFTKKKLLAGAEWLRGKAKAGYDKTAEAIKSKISITTGGLEVNTAGGGVKLMIKRLTQIRNLLAGGSGSYGGKGGKGGDSPMDENSFDDADYDSPGIFSRMKSKAGRGIQSVKNRFRGSGAAAQSMFGRFGTGVGNVLGATGRGLGHVGSGIGKGLGWGIDKAAYGLGWGAGKIGNGIGHLKDATPGALAALRNAGVWTGEQGLKAGRGIFKGAGWGLGKLGTGLGKAKTLGGDLLDGVGNLYRDKMPGLKEKLSGTGSRLKALGGSALDHAGRLLSGDKWETLKGLGGTALGLAGKAGTGIKNMAKGLKDKFFGESKTEKRLLDIYNVLNTRLPKAKQHIVGDSDGDGVRNGSFADIMNRRKNASKGTELGKTAETKATSGPGLLGGAKSLWNKIRGKDENGNGGGLDVNVGGGPNGPRAPGGKTWGQSKGWGGKAKFLAGKGWGLAKGAGSLAMSAMGLSGLGTIAGAGTAIASGIGAVGSGLAAGAGMVGSGLAAVGAFLSMPVVLGALAVAAVGVGGYMAYKYLTRKKADTALVKMRYSQYGFSASDTDHLNAVFGLEDQLTEALTFDGGVPTINSSKVDTEKLMKNFDIDKDNKEDVNAWGIWFTGRFKPVFLTHIASLKAAAPDKSLGDVNDLKAPEKRKYLTAAKFPAGPYGSMVSPFPGGKSLSEGSAEVTAAIAAAEAEMVKEEIEDKTKPKAGAAKAVVTSAVLAGALVVPGAAGGIGAIPNAAGGTSAVVTAGAAAFGTSGLGGGNVMSLTGVAARDSVSIEGKVDPLSTVRFKAYGLLELELDKVKALLSLESEVNKNISYEKGSVAKWSGSVDDIIKSTGGLFGSAGPGTETGSKMEAWFILRFMPVYLNYLTLISISTNKTDPKSSADALTPKGSLEAAIGLCGTTSNYGGSTVSVWQITESPWPSYSLNGIVNTTAENIETLKSKVKTTVLTEQSNGPTSESGVSGKSAGAAAATAAALSKPATPPPPTAPSSSQGFFSKLGSDMLGGAKAIVSDIGDAAKGAYQSVRAGVINTGNAVNSMLGGTAIVHPGNGTGGNINDIPEPTSSGNYAGLKATIDAASKMVGVDPKLMATMAAIESGFNYKVKAGTSSASGLYQFIDSTWNMMLKKHGPKYGLASGTSQTDPRANALMGAEYIKENLNVLKGAVNRPITDTDIYMAHFLGGGGAKKFLSSDPNAIAANILPDAARANQNIFYNSDKSPRTVAEVYAHLNDLVKKKGKAFGLDATTTDAVNDKGSKETAGGAKPGIPVSDTTLGVSTAAGAKASAPTGGAAPSAGGSGTTAPATAPSTAAAALGSGFTTPRSKDLDAQTNFQRDLSGEAIGKVSTTLDKSLEVQIDQLTALRSILTIMGSFPGVTSSSNDSNAPSVPKPGGVAKATPIAPVSMSKPKW
jgi:hypothetical protein